MPRISTPPASGALPILGLAGHELLLARFQLAAEPLQLPAEGGRDRGHEFALLHTDVLLDALPKFRERGMEPRVTGLQTPQGGDQGLDLLVFLQ